MKERAQLYHTVRNTSCAMHLFIAAVNVDLLEWFLSLVASVQGSRKHISSSEQKFEVAFFLNHNFIVYIYSTVSQV